MVCFAVVINLFVIYLLIMF